MQDEQNNPKWDVALEAMARDEFSKARTGLKLDDFHRLAKQHAIRFDDIMETMFLLVIHRRWSYRQSDGTPRVLNQETLDSLYVRKRLSDADLEAFDGSWQPLS